MTVRKGAITAEVNVKNLRMASRVGFRLGPYVK